MAGCGAEFQPERQGERRHHAVGRCGRKRLRALRKARLRLSEPQFSLAGAEIDLFGIGLGLSQERAASSARYMANVVRASGGERQSLPHCARVLKKERRRKIMTAEERLRQAMQRRAPQNSVAVSPTLETMLRSNPRGCAHVAQQARQIESTRRYEAEKKAQWDRGR